jgi:hypothetical protein
MRRGRSGIGTELVPLVLILASLAGSLALVIAIHHRFVTRSTLAKPPVAVVATPAPEPPRPKPIARPTEAPQPEVDEPETPPPPPPEDPTPKVVTNLVAAEAEQLLEASKADRKAAALEEARKAAIAESEKWRRRESLVRLQLDSLETKVHQLETQADEYALERDALEKEVDARKALAAQARSRPSTAILPHRGQNGTWRRPIVVECVNGMAILRPQNAGFGLLDLASGFSPATNPFVGAVAREAIRIQGNASPDGQPVTPYIFFLVRPDGIRTYYEARGRLEPLGITFGYELADQDWQIDFPDLDDTQTWDGSGPAPPPRPDPLAQLRSRQSGASPAEEESLPNLDVSLPGAANPPTRGDGPGNEFTWPSRPKAAPTNNGRVSLGGTGSGTGSGGIGNSRGTSPSGPSGEDGGSDRLSGLANSGNGYAGPGGSGGRSIRYPGGTSGAGTADPISGTGSGSGAPNPSGKPRELSLGGSVTPLPPTTSGNSGSPNAPSGSGLNSSPSSSNPSNAGSLPPVVSPRMPPNVGSGDLVSQPPQSSTANIAEPASPYVLPSPGIPADQIAATGGGSTSPPPVSPNQTPPVRHLGPFSRPLAEGIDPALIANASNPPPSTAPTDDSDPTQPDPVNPGNSSGLSGSTNSNPKAGTGSTPMRVIGQSDNSVNPAPSGSPQPPLTLGLPTPGSPPSGMPPIGSPPTMMPPIDNTNPPPSSKPAPRPPVSRTNFKMVDRNFEIVVVCNQRGVIVQPGAYRVTVDALRSRDGLLKTEIVALVKAKRTANPKLTIEPRVRFLVQPGGENTYWTARSQFLLAGLDWPMTTQVADRDVLTILPSESW